MRSCDAAATERYGMPSLLLMENAARGASDVALHLLRQTVGKKVLVLCGKGNNGGDGYAIARHLANRGAEVTVLSLAPVEGLAGDAHLNAEIVLRIAEADGTLQLGSLHVDLDDALRRRPDLVVDALLGTGLSSPISGIVERAIRTVNESGIDVLAVDIPTGIDADTGEILGSAVRAKATATMGAWKTGLLLGEGRIHAGRVEVVDIGVPREVYSRFGGNTFLPSAEDVFSRLPHRRFDAHKYRVGSVFGLVGSIGMTGAGVLAGEAALRSGCGIVHLGVPAPLNTIFEEKLTEVLTVPLPSTPSASLAREGLPEILGRMQAATVAMIGPGLSRQEETLELVRTVIATAPVPLVLDADALYALIGQLDVLRSSATPKVLTPHTGEFSRLLERSCSEIERHRIDVSRAFAVEHGVVLTLKGAPTVTAGPDGSVWVNTTGNPGMATAGCGDVLTGMIAGLMAQGMTSLDAARCGVWLHGKAGDIASSRRGRRGMLAGDILHHIPDAFLPHPGENEPETHE
ncbi:MAG: NAD(P)H-hydrate dehydratase [Bacteroidota bacterium]|nr:NAD(P)H-hydrate dehydratase [Bacteroidota bacterium]